MLFNELISSKIQLKWVQEVWARPVSRCSVREFAEIEHMQREDFVEVEWRSLVIFSDMDNQRARILISKGSRTDRLLEMSNAQQSEPQWTDLHLHARTYQQSATPHVHLLRGCVRLH